MMLAQKKKPLHHPVAWMDCHPGIQLITFPN
jgi:hypothetical protein